MSSRLDLVETLAAIRDVRRERDVVITTMGASREWMALGPPQPPDPRPLVFAQSGPSHV